VVSARSGTRGGVILLAPRYRDPERLSGGVLGAQTRFQLVTAVSGRSSSYASSLCTPAAAGVSAPPSGRTLG
jgi:hypothetical protein